jgi:hypothetical protein
VTSTTRPSTARRRRRSSGPRPAIPAPIRAHRANRFTLTFIGGSRGILNTAITATGAARIPSEPARALVHGRAAGRRGDGAAGYREPGAAHPGRHPSTRPGDPRRCRVGSCAGTAGQRLNSTLSARVCAAFWNVS